MMIMMMKIVMMLVKVVMMMMMILMIIILIFCNFFCRNLSIHDNFANCNDIADDDDDEKL